jgi:hypothetical protein
VTPDQRLALLRRYEPVIRFTRGELFFPAAVEPYIEQCALLRRDRAGDQLVAAAGTLTLDLLAEYGRRHPGDSLNLQCVPAPLSRRELRRWRGRGGRPTFRSSSRFAAVGLLARFIDAVLRLTLVLRGKVPGGFAAAAQRAYSTTTTAEEDYVYYGAVTTDGGYLVLQYWYFYWMNDWRSTFGGVNDHEADWEQVTVFVAAGGEKRLPAWVAFSSHDAAGADLRRRWDDPDLELVGSHPVVYAGAGSHSGAYLAGEYLVTAHGELPGWVDRLRAVGRRLLPPRVPVRSGIGIPFLDYHRGDGVGVGEGTDHRWRPVLIDDDTTWVRHYRGLWGLDTRDPLGGERAPAGPRYERSKAVRASWSRPVAWAGLDGEPTDDEAAQTSLTAARASVAAALRAADQDLAERRDLLRAARTADRALGLSPSTPGARRRALETEVSELRTSQTSLRALLEGLDNGLTGPLPTEDAHAHLRRRALPLGAQASRPGWLLRVWAAASVSVVLAVLGVLLLLDKPVLGPAVTLTAAMLTIEACLRRRLLSFLLGLAGAAVAGAVVWVGASLVLGNLATGVGLLLLLASAYLVAQGVREGLRSR